MAKALSKTKEAELRRQMGYLVEDRLMELGCTSFVDMNRKYGYDRSLFDGELCTLVNHLCPDDLCYLPYGHIGAKEGYHILGTVNYSYAERMEFPMAPEGTSRSALITCAARMAHRIEGDPHAAELDLQMLMERCLPVCEIPACGCDGTPHS